MALLAPDAMTDRGQIIALTHSWIGYDWLRVTLSFAGLICSIRALSVPFPEPASTAAPPSRSLKLVWAIALAAAVAFVACFLFQNLPRLVAHAEAR